MAKGYFRQYRDAFTEALGLRRYVLVPLFGAVVGFVDWVFSRLEDFGVSAFFGVSPFVVGVVAALLMLAYFLLDHIVKLRARLAPQVRISYDDTKLNCHKPVLHSADRGRTTYPGRSIRLLVESDSDANVEQCSGFLTRIEYRTHGGQFSDAPLYEPTYLHWTLEDPHEYDPITVYPRVPRYLGICGTEEPRPGFRIKTKHRSFVTPESFNESGEYRIHIEIVAAQAPPKSAVMLITWNGKWNEIKACLVEST